MAEEQTTQWPKEKIQKEYSESVYGRRTDNTMAKRKSTKGVFRNRLSSYLNSLNTTKSTTYNLGNPDPGLGQEQRCACLVHPVNKSYIMLFRVHLIMSGIQTHNLLFSIKYIHVHVSKTFQILC
jgi:hypothetical protein